MDKCVILNEMARMFLHFGDRRLAISSYMKSSEVEFSLKDINVQYQPNLVRLYCCVIKSFLTDVYLLQSSTSWCMGHWVNMQSLKTNFNLFSKD